MKPILFLSAILFCTTLSASTITEDFTTSDNNSTSSTAVWNLVSKKVHLPFRVTDPTPSRHSEELFATQTLSIGSGKDGVFDNTTYNNHDMNNGSSPGTITLNTDNNYEFTTFTLDAGYTVKAKGEDPLRIRVQGDVLINGSINLNGGNGESINSNESITPAGGTNCCGGSTGGSGGSDLTAASAGSGTGGGQPGTVDGIAGGGGGGGGGYREEGVKGFAPARLHNDDEFESIRTGGVGGSIWGDASISTLIGGSGGGGGAKHTGDSSGGGGGAGGGALEMICGGDFTVDGEGTATILAKGGDGGDGNGFEAGGGGGGSGGSIALLIGGNIHIKGADPSIDGRPGSGGASTGGGNGGNGAVGRLRLATATTYNDWTVYAVSEDPGLPTDLTDYGIVSYAIDQNYIIESKSFDTGNSAPTYNSIEGDETKPGGTSIAYALATSSDDFQDDASDFVDSDSLSELTGKRYVKYRITLGSTDTTKTPEVNSVTIDYTEKVQPTFTFTLAGCARVSPRTTTHGLSFLLTLLAWIGVVKMMGTTMVRHQKGHQSR